MGEITYEELRRVCDDTRRDLEADAEAGGDPDWLDAIETIEDRLLPEGVRG